MYVNLTSNRFVFQISRNHCLCTPIVITGACLFSSIVIVGVSRDAHFGDVIKKGLLGTVHDVGMAARAGHMRLVVLHTNATLNEARLVEGVGV